MDNRKNYGANHLTSLLSGDDTMKAIADLFVAYWNRQYQGVLLSILNGVFTANNMTDKVHDITAETGDKGLISGRTFLAKNDLIEYKEESEGKARVPCLIPSTKRDR